MDKDRKLLINSPVWEAFCLASAHILQLKLPEKPTKDQMARQNPGDKRHEKGRVANRTYMFSVKACTTKRDWPCHKSAW